MNWILTILHAFSNGPLPLLRPNGVKTDPSQWGKVAQGKAASGWHEALLEDWSQVSSSFENPNLSKKANLK